MMREGIEGIERIEGIEGVPHLRFDRMYRRNYPQLQRGQGLGDIPPTTGGEKGMERRGEERGENPC